MCYAPEYFAKVTCSNLGLPLEMEPVIAHGIRENIYKILFNCIDITYNKVKNNTPIPCISSNKYIQTSVSEIQVNIVGPNQAIDMITNLWKRAKPSHFDDCASAPQPRLPRKLDSNASIWDVIEVKSNITDDQSQANVVANSITKDPHTNDPI